MTIRFTCSCGRPLAVPDEKAGTRGRCPKCRQVVEIPKAGPPDPAAEEQLFICPKCGAIGEPGATACAPCDAPPRPVRTIMHVEQSTIFDAAPFRWIGEHKLKIGAAGLVIAIYLVYSLFSSPGSKAYDTYRQFADLIVQGDYEHARQLAEGAALGQIDGVRDREGVDKMKRETMTARALYTLNSERLSGNGNSSTLHLTQEYWSTIAATLITKGERMERVHTAQMALRDGKWKVTSFLMGPPRAPGAGTAAEAVAKTSPIKVDAEGWGLSSQHPLGNFKNLDERITEAGLPRGQAEEGGRWSGEVTRTQPYDYPLRTKEGGTWPESIEVVINLDRMITRLIATFRLSSAAGTPLEESRVARFAADAWKLVFGAAAALDKDGRAATAKGGVTGEWKQDRAQGREVVTLSLKAGESSGREGGAVSGSKAQAGAMLDIGVLQVSGEVFTAGKDRCVTVFRRLLTEEKLQHPGAVNAAVSLPDGMTLVTGCSDGKIREWRRKIMDEQFNKTAEWDAHAGGVATLAAHPGGDGVASAGADGNVKLWAGATLKSTLKGPASGVTDLCFRPDGSALAAAGKDGTVRLWSIPGGEEQHTFTGHAGAALSVALDTSLLASGGADGMVKVWSLKDRGEKAALKGHEGGVKALLFLEAGRGLLSCGEDGTARVWETGSGKSLQVFRSFSGFTCAALGSRGWGVLTGGEDGSRRDLQIARINIRAPRKPTPPEPPARSAPLGRSIYTTKRLMIAPNGNVLIIWHPNEGAEGWSPAQAKSLWSVRFPTFPQSAAMSPDGKHWAAGLHDYSIRVYEVETGREVMSVPGLPVPAVTLALSPGARRAASEQRILETMSRVRVWDVAAKKQLSELACRDGFEARVLCFTPDGERVAVGMTDGSIQLFDAGTGKLLRNLTGHDQAVEVLVSSADGSLLASSGNDGSVRVWRVADGAQLTSYHDHSGPVSSLAFAPKGGFLASAGGELFLHSVADEKDSRLLVEGIKQEGEVAFPDGGAELMWVERVKGEARFWKLEK